MAFQVYQDKKSKVEKRNRENPDLLFSGWVVILDGWYIILSGILLIPDLIGKPKWILKYKVQPNEKVVYLFFIKNIFQLVTLSTRFVNLYR